MPDCLTFTIGAISAIGMAVRHYFMNVGPILKDTGHFDRQIAGRYFEACFKNDIRLRMTFYLT